jgi:putative ABC transport system permease protein
MLRLALRNVVRHKLRTALTLAAIGSGVAGLVLSGGFVEDSLVQLREATIHSQLGHLQVHRADSRQDGSPAQPKSMIDDPQNIMTR